MAETPPPAGGDCAAAPYWSHAWRIGVLPPVLLGLAACWLTWRPAPRGGDGPRLLRPPPPPPWQGASDWQDDPLYFEELARSRPRGDQPGSNRSGDGGAAEHRRLDVAEDPFEWVRLSREAAFCPRFAHAAIIDGHNRIFVIGGAASKGSGSEYLDDVWMSEDSGGVWTQISDPKYPPRFSGRRGHSAVMDSHRVVMFLLGGFCGHSCKSRYLNDWWSSEGGDIWHDLTMYAPAKWSPRHGHASVVTSQDLLLVFGGHDGNGYLNDVWYIRDPAQAHVWGGTWVKIQAAAPWERRYGHTAVVDAQDRILLAGGLFADKGAGRVECFNDVWSSQDGGREWTLVTDNAPWTGRYQHASAVSPEGDVFIVGGLDVDLQRCRDTWRSQDAGARWHRVTEVAPWTARYEHAVVVDRKKSLYVIGGMSTGQEEFNDVWRSMRTCKDDVKCPGASEVCRDGTNKHFAGLPNPICVHICDRRIFDKCTVKEACQVQHGKAVCVDPCDEKSCGKGEVCEVEPRGGRLPEHSEQLKQATPFCLACNDAKTKFACDPLRQCVWTAEAEACLTKCTVLLTKHTCEAEGDRCQWDVGSCHEKPQESDDE